MNWVKQAITDVSRIKNNIKRYQLLKAKLAGLKKIVFSTQSNTHLALQELLNDTLIKANKPLEEGVNFLIKGENNQSVVRDAPHRTSKIMDNMISFIDFTIIRLKNELNKLYGKN